MDIRHIAAPVELSTGKTVFYVRGWVFLGEKTVRTKKSNACHKKDRTS
jgi:hypothetical protein